MRSLSCNGVSFFVPLPVPLIAATMSKLPSQYSGKVPQSSLDTMLSISVGGYSSCNQAHAGQHGLNAAIQSYHSGHGSAAVVS